MNSIRILNHSKPMLWIGSLIGVLLLLIAALAIYIGSRPEEWWRDLVTTTLSQTLGREVKIEGDFRLQLGRRITTEAASMRISNPDWTDSRDMLRLGSLELEFDLLSALGKTLLIHRLVLTDIELALEENQDGDKNWAFASEAKPPPAPKEGEGITLPVYIEQLSLQHAQLSVTQPRWERPLVLQVDTIFGGLSPDDKLVLDGSGQVGELPFSLKGSLGKISSMLNKGPVSYQVSGKLGQAGFHSKGSIDSLKAPLKPNLNLSFSGPDILQITRSMGAPKIAEGPFKAHTSIMPGGRGMNGRIQGKFGMLKLDAAISTKDLDPMENIDILARLSGENLAALSDLFGLPPLPEGPFEIDADLHRDNSNTHIEKIIANVGKHRISVRGFVGAWPELKGTRIELQAGGPDLAVFTPSVAGIGLGQIPHGPYAIDALIESSELDLNLRSSKLTAGDYQVTAEGQIFTKDRLRAELKVSGSGPDLSMITRLVDTIQLPAWPFQAKGKVDITSEGVTIIGASGTTGKHKFALDGPIAFSSAGPMRVEVNANGPSLQAVLQGLGYNLVPASAAYQVEGKVEIANNRLEVTTKHAQLGPAEASAILSIPDLHSPTTLMLDVREFKTTDISTALGLVGVKVDLPQVMPANLSGQIKRTKGTTRLTKLRGSIGNTSLNVDGTIGDPPDYDKTRVSLNISGSNLEPFLTHPIAQAIPFQIEGRMAMDKGHTRFDNLQLKLANIEARVHGSVGSWKDIAGSELNISAQAPNPEAIAALLNRPLPVGVVKFEGQIHTAKDAFYIERMKAQLGPSNLSGNLTLTRGEPPELKGKLSSTYLDFALFQKSMESEQVTSKSVKDTSNSDATDTSKATTPHKKQILLLPDTSTGVEAFDQLDRDSGIRGLFQEDAESWQISNPGTDRKNNMSTRGTDSVATAQENWALLFQDTPIELEAFDQIDLDLEIHINELANLWELVPLHEISADILLKGRKLSVSGFEVHGQYGGIVKGDLLIAPDADLTRFDVDITGEQLRLGLGAAPGQEPATYPPFDMEAKFNSNGRTYHELANSLDGRIKVIQGEGRVNNSRIDILLSDVLYELFQSVNPVAKTEQTTRLDCGVYIINLVDGKADIQAVVIQTDKLTILSAGTIDLNTEQINVDFATRPRKGVGISASTITNAYTRLGGTLSKPSIVLDPGRATLATGVGVATGGLSFLYKGIWDRFFTTRDPCGMALKRDAELQSKKAKQHR